MPIRDFTCNECHRPFEKLVRNGEAPACPACGSTNLHQHLSAFAVGAGKPEPMPASCGSCGGVPGSCQFAPATH